MPSANPENETVAYILDKLGEYENTDADRAFIAHARKVFADDLLAVVLYGSTLYKTERKRSGIIDYFVIIDSYRRLEKGGLPRLWAKLAPPLQYSVRLDDSLPGRLPSAKYHVLSMRDLERGAGPGAKDAYILGRFSKRTALLYSSSAGTSDRISSVVHSATAEIVRRSIPYISTECDLDDKIKQCLYFSYRAEIRIENFSKVEGIFENGREYYRKIFGEVLDRYFQGRAQDVLPPPTTAEAASFTKRCRRRGVLRWPVMMFTVDGWPDILLHKLERTHGEKIELTDQQRKHPLLAGWKHFSRLKREGKIR